MDLLFSTAQVQEMARQAPRRQAPRLRARQAALARDAAARAMSQRHIHMRRHQHMAGSSHIILLEAVARTATAQTTTTIIHAHHAEAMGIIRTSYHIFLNVTQ